VAGGGFWATLFKKVDLMNKSELLDWLQAENRQWEALLAQIGPERMEQGGVVGYWSIKNIVAHLTPDNQRLIAQLQAAQRSEPEPPPPWPAHLQADDDINAWIYETQRERPARDILAESQQVFQQLLATVEGLPDDVRIETVHQGPRAYYFVWLGGQRLQPGYFFDHFHDDHESDIRAWMARAARM
jgi:hypothetical protein